MLKVTNFAKSQKKFLLTYSTHNFFIHITVYFPLNKYLTEKLYIFYKKNVNS